MLTGVVKVQCLGCSWPSVLDYVPNPRRPIGYSELGFGPRQTPLTSLLMQSPTQLHRLGLATDHCLLTQHSPTVFASTVLLQIKDASLQFVPFYAALLRFLFSPTRPALAHLPPIEHQHRHSASSRLWSLLPGCLFQPLLHLLFRPLPQRLRQMMQAGVIGWVSQLVPQRDSAFIGSRGGDRKGQSLHPSRAHLLMRRHFP